MASAVLDESEVVSRFALESSKFRSTGMHYRAFLPNPADMATSVFLVHDLSEDEIWMLGDSQVGSAVGRRVLARGDLAVVQVKQAQLQVVLDDAPHPRHANIVGWPAEKAEQMHRAQALAAAARMFVRPTT